MRERAPEQLSIFDVMPELEKPEDFFIEDSFDSKVKGDVGDRVAFEKAAYIGEKNLQDNLFTIYVRCIKDKKNGTEKFVVSVPSIGFDFGYNSAEKLLAEWDIQIEKLRQSNEIVKNGANES